MIGGLIGYAVVRYLLPELRKQLVQKIESFQLLRDTSTKLSQDLKDVEEARHDDLVFQKTLKEKHAVWCKLVEQQQQAFQNEREERQKLLREKMTFQIKKIEQQRLQRMVFPEALAQAEDQLKKKYRSDSAQEKVVTQLCDYLGGHNAR